MGTIGDCYDSMIESFWGRMQTELLNRRRWRTCLELAKAIFEYLEIFHNRQRRHSVLGMLTPGTPLDRLNLSNPTPPNPGHIRMRPCVGRLPACLKRLTPPSSAS
jgi:transposase InsO family protein